MIHNENNVITDDGEDTSNDINNSTKTSTSPAASATDTTTRSSDNYVYGISADFVLFIGVGVFFLHIIFPRNNAVCT